MIELKYREYTILLDDDTPEEILKCHWYVDKCGDRLYVKRKFREGGKHKSVYLHRQIMSVTERGVYVDHKNHNTLDNRKENLRICTPAENMHNSRSNDSVSGYKGVSRTKEGLWRARIYKGKEFILGVSECPMECARAYNKAAIEMFGEFAYLNVVEDGPICEKSILSRQNSSGYLGVYFSKQAGKFMAAVIKDGKTFYAGTHTNAEAAARARDARAIELHGPKAKLNFP